MSLWARCRRYWAGSAAYRLSVLVEEHFVIERRCEIGVVHDVKELSAELNVEAVRDFLHLEVLEHREIQVDQAGADHAGASVVTEQIHASAWDFVSTAVDGLHAHGGVGSGCSRRSKTLQLQVVDTSGIDRIFARSTGDATGIGPRITTALAEWIAGHHQRHWCAGVGAKNSAEFPAAQNEMPHGSAKLWRGKVPNEVKHKVMRDVEVTKSTPAVAVKEHQARKGIFVWIAEQAARSHVYAFAPGVAPLRLKAVAHSL